MIQSIIDARIPQPTVTNQILVWNNTTGLLEASVSLSGLTMVSPDITGTVNNGGGATAFGGAVTGESFTATTGGSALSFIFNEAGGDTGLAFTHISSDDIVWLQVDGVISQSWFNDSGDISCTIHSDLDVEGNITTGQYIGDTDDTELIEIDGAGGIVTVDGNLCIQEHAAFGSSATIKTDTIMEVIESVTDPSAVRGLNFTLTGSGNVRNAFTGVNGGLSLTDLTDAPTTLEAAVFKSLVTINNPGAFTIPETLGFYSDYSHSVSGTVTDHYNFYAASGSAIFGATLVNQYGLYIDSQSAGTNGFGVFQVGSSDINIFAGNMSVGKLTTPAEALDLVGNIIATGDVSGATLTAGDGFTGTGAYTNFTITNGIITAAS